MRIYRKFPDTLHTHIDYVITESSVSIQQKRLAHPLISQDDLETFLQRLGDGTPYLDPLDIAMLTHLRITSISEDNVKRVARSLRA